MASQTSLRGTDFSQEVTQKGWYHSFELPSGERIDGYNSLEILRERWAQFRLPEDLSGARMLDIGAWDGWFSFEAERRGALVTSIDCVEIQNFVEMRKRLASKADYRILDFYELPSSGLAAFDYVLFLGVLYHLKHPLLALEIVCALTTTTAIVDSFVTDPGTWQDHTADVPAMEFYETDELGNQLDNWIGPGVGCLKALCRAAGFARVELLGIIGSHACLACHRQWEPLPSTPKADAPELISALNSRTFGVNFGSRKEEYVACWFRTGRASVTRELLRLEIGPFGIPALYTKQQEDTWLANFRLPPGLTAGWHDVRLRFADTSFGAVQRIAVDLPLLVSAITIREVYDGATWKRDAITSPHAVCWVAGLPDNCDRANIRAWLGEIGMIVEHVGATGPDGFRQINLRIPAGTPASGNQTLRLECGGCIASKPVSVTPG